MRAGALAVVLSGAVALGSYAWAQEPAPPAPAPAPPDVKALFESACSACHSAAFAAEARKSRPDWEQTVSRMVDRGAALDPDEAALVVDYLARTYPARPAAETKPPAG